MVTLFGLLLFWFGFIVAIIGCLAIAIKSTYRETGVVGVFVHFIMSGALLMGSAGVNFSYTPPPKMSWPIAIILWMVLIIGTMIASVKPTFIKEKQEDTEPPN